MISTEYLDPYLNCRKFINIFKSITQYLLVSYKDLPKEIVSRIDITHKVYTQDSMNNKYLEKCSNADSELLKFYDI